MDKNFTPYNEIKEVKFYILGNEDNLIDSACEVKTPELFRNNVPVENGIYSLKQGTTDMSFKCLTCFNKKTLCPGHPAHLTLKYPVISPLFRKELIKWLKIICFNCHELIFDYDLMPKNIKQYKKLEFFISHYRKFKNNFIRCYHCNSKNYDISNNSKDFLDIIINIDGKDKELYIHEIEDVVNSITDETVIKLGKSLDCHPKKMVLRIIRIPPNSIRPDIKKYKGGRSNNNDLTTIIKNIVEIQNKLEPMINDEVIEKNIKNLKTIEMYYNHLIKKPPVNSNAKLQSTGNAPLRSLTDRLKNKTGRIRGNIMAKRTSYMARSVISGDNFIKIDEVGIPISIAKNIQVPEKVTVYNRNEMMIYFKNGINEYPGASEVVKHSSGKKYTIKNIKNDFILEVGDILYRDIVDGDPVAMNRAPSILFSSISGHSAKVLHEGDTLRLSVNVADTLYKGDFDGDAMTLLIPHQIISKNECATLCDLKRWFVSYTDGKPSIGIYHDSLIGIFHFTKNNIKINKHNVNFLLSQINFNTVNEILKDNNLIDKNYNGREILSLLLKSTNINYNGKSNHYKEEYVEFINYEPDEIKVEIDRGEIKMGRLDKKTVGQGVDGSIFHILHNELGSKKTLDILYNMQQIVTFFLMHHGFTVNYDDITISKDAMKVVNEKTSSIIYESEMINNKLHNGEIIAPIDKTINEFYEEMQLALLTLGDDFLKPVLANIDTKNNNLYNLISSGSKGKFLNLLQISSAIGQTTINGERIKKLFGYERNMPYFTRFHTSPESRGFVKQSYTSGVTNTDFIFQCMEARYSLINKALSTSITGYQNRKSVKNLETLIIDNRRKCTKAFNIVQMLYGSDGIDTRKTEVVKFNSIMISDNKFKETYKCNIDMLDKIYHNDNVKKLLEDEFEQLKIDRNEYRRIFLTIESRNNKSKLLTNTQRSPVNIYRIIEDTMYKYREIIKDNKEKLNPIEFFEKIKNLKNDLLYTHYNEIQRKLKYEVSEYIKKSFFLINILINSNLYLKNIIEKNIPLNILDIMINRIINTFKNSLIDYGTPIGIITAQCISGPMTQYVLDSHHRSGSGATKINFLQRMKELLGAQPTEKMKAPSMNIFLKEEYNNEMKIREIANNIEMMQFKTFIDYYQIFFENYKKITHPDYIEENETFINNFEKHNPGVTIPNNLINYCIRIGINKETIIEKNMTVDLIVFRLNQLIPELHIIYLDDNSKNNIIFRIYIRSTYFKKYSKITLNIVDTFVNKTLLNIIIRGINNIVATNINNHIARSYIDDEGIIQKKNIYSITTLGTNIDGILNNKYIDPYLTYSDSIIEIQETLGIEAAREKIIIEIRNMMPSAGDKHYMLYADEMTYTGSVTSIEKKGLETREKNNILLQLSLSHVVQILEKSAINNFTANAEYGLSAPLMCGQIPKTCANYNDVIINEQFINETKQNIKSFIDDF